MSVSPQPNDADTIALQRAQDLWSRIRDSSPIYDFLLANIKLGSASEGSVIAKLVVGPRHVNSSGTLHGAVSATIADWAGGMAIATTGLKKTGASLDIHVTYVSTARIGDELEIDAVANKVGKSIAFTSMKINKVSENGSRTVVATATHTKYVFQKAT